MLAEIRRHARRDLVLAADPDRRIHRLEIAVGERHEYVVFQGLRIIGDVGHRRDNLEQYAARVEARAPVGAIARREGRVEFVDQGARMRQPVWLGAKARVVCKIWPFHAGDQLWPQPLLVVDRQDQPLPVAALVERRQRIAGQFPWLRRRKLRAAKRRLHEKGVGPNAAGDQRRRHFRALPRLLAPVERHQNTRQDRERRRMIAHATGRARRRRARCANRVHHARARPPGRRVEAWLFGLGALVAIAGERRIDQTRIEPFERGEIETQLFTHAHRIVGDEHVGVGAEAPQYFLAVGRGEIDGDAPLVARVHDPRKIVLGRGLAGRKAGLTIGVACRRFDLDHLGAEIRQDGRRSRRGDEARAVDDLEAVEEMLHHAQRPFHCGARFARKESIPSRKSCEA